MTNEDKPAAAVGSHKGLQFVVFLQLMCVLVCCLVVIHTQSTDGNVLPWAQLFANPHHRFWISFLSLLLYFVACAYLRTVFPTHHLWLLKSGLIFATVCLCLFASSLAAMTVCDPIVRVVRDGELDKMLVLGQSLGLTVAHHMLADGKPHTFLYGMPQHPDLLLTPLSQVSGLGPGWLAETTPDFFQCAALTPYALEGRLMVGLALVNIAAAFLLTTTLARIAPRSVHATIYAIIGYCFVFVVLVQCICAVVINDSMWDWRVVCLTLASAVTSSYLSASAVHLPAPPQPPHTTTTASLSNFTEDNKTQNTQLLPKAKPPPPPLAVAASQQQLPSGSIARTTWLTIQPILAVEYFLDQLDEPDEPSATPLVQPTATAMEYPAAGTLYHA